MCHPGPDEVRNDPGSRKIYEIYFTVTHAVSFYQFQGNISARL